MPEELRPEDMERRLFYLEAFLQTSNELAGLTQPRSIMDCFLLMLIGPMGVTQGAIALLDTISGRGIVTGRGFSPEGCYLLEKKLAGIYQQSSFLFLDRGLPVSRQTLPEKGIKALDLLPFKAELLLPWKIDDRYQGFTALGSKIIKRFFDREEIDLLFNINLSLPGFLGSSILHTNIEQLNTDLQQKNNELQQSIAELHLKEQLLDRKVFHLQVINDLNSELRIQNDPYNLLNSFLLSILGIYSFSSGFIFILQRKFHHIFKCIRGNFKPNELNISLADKLLYRALNGIEDKSMQDLSVQFINNIQDNFQDIINPVPKMGIFFFLDKDNIGLLLLADRVDLQSGPSDGDIELLKTQTLAFSVYLKQTLNMVQVVQLNQELERSNIELRSTVAQLTQARQTIHVLEKTRENIKQAIQAASEKIAKASCFDFIFIFSAAMVMGIIFNFKNPAGVELWAQPWSKKIASSLSIQDVGRKIRTHPELLIIDARPQAFFKQGHMKGAINIPPSLFDIMYAMHLADIDLEHPILIYGRNISSRYDQKIARKLYARDHENLYIFPEGYAQWQKLDLSSN